MCDVVYALQVERVEREALVQWQAGVAAAAAGAEGVELRVPADVRAEFDAALVAAPEPVMQLGRHQRELRRILGVA